MSRLFSLAFIFALVAIACVRAQEDMVGDMTVSNVNENATQPLTQNLNVTQPLTAPLTNASTNATQPLMQNATQPLTQNLNVTQPLMQNATQPLTQNATNAPPPQASPVPEAEPVLSKANATVPVEQPIMSPLQENKTEDLVEKMVNLGVKNLTLSRYMGGWFLIAVSKHIKDAEFKDCACARGLHKQLNESAFTTTYSCLNKTTGDISIANATLNSLNLTNAGLYSMKFDKMPWKEKQEKIDGSDSTSKYIILKSKFGKDGNYRLSLVGSPAEKGVYLQSRSKRISKNMLRKLNSYILDNKISDSPLARVQQELCELDYQKKRAAHPELII